MQKFNMTIASLDSIDMGTSSNEFDLGLKHNLNSAGSNSRRRNDEHGAGFMRIREEGSLDNNSRQDSKRFLNADDV